MHTFLALPIRALLVVALPLDQVLIILIVVLKFVLIAAASLLLVLTIAVAASLHEAAVKELIYVHLLQLLVALLQAPGVAAVIISTGIGCVAQPKWSDR